MCDPISLALTIGLTAATSFAQAAMTSANAKQAAIIEQNQLRQEMENERIKAMSETNDVLEDFRKTEATNRAMLSASGINNTSYQQGIEPFNRKVAGRDVRNLQFNAGQVIGRKKYEISVAGYRSKATSRSAFIEAGVNTLGKVGSTFAENRSFFTRQP
jgi:hypothetical protein